jgi:hypothetical protein
VRERQDMVVVPLGLLADLLCTTDPDALRRGGDPLALVGAAREALIAWVRAREAEAPGLEFRGWVPSPGAGVPRTPVAAPGPRSGEPTSPVATPLADCSQNAGGAPSPSLHSPLPSPQATPPQVPVCPRCKGRDCSIPGLDRFLWTCARCLADFRAVGPLL